MVVLVKMTPVSKKRGSQMSIIFWSGETLDQSDFTVFLQIISLFVFSIIGQVLLLNYYTDLIVGYPSQIFRIFLCILTYIRL